MVDKLPKTIVGRVAVSTVHVLYSNVHHILKRLEWFVTIIQFIYVIVHHISIIKP